MMETAQLVGQGLAIILLGRMVWHLGHVAGAVDGLAERLSHLEVWRDNNLPKL